MIEGGTVSQQLQSLGRAHGYSHGYYGSKTGKEGPQRKPGETLRNPIRFQISIDHSSSISLSCVPLLQLVTREKKEHSGGRHVNSPETL